MNSANRPFLTTEIPFEEWKMCFLVAESTAKRAIELPEHSSDIIVHGDIFIHDRTLLYPDDSEHYKTASIIGITALGEQTSLTSVHIKLPGVIKKTIAKIIKKEPHAIVYIENISNSE